MKIPSAERLILLMLIVIIGNTIILTTITAYGYLQITSPTKGKKVPVGNIVISGTSSSNSTNNCTVSVAVNGIKPYQQAIPVGHNGTNDYSSWTFTNTANYTAIKEGINKISTKYSCPQDMNLTKTYSVNVIGEIASTAGKRQALVNTTATNNGFPLLLPGH